MVDKTKRPAPHLSLSPPPNERIKKNREAIRHSLFPHVSIRQRRPTPPNLPLPPCPSPTGITCSSCPAPRHHRASRLPPSPHPPAKKLIRPKRCLPTSPLHQVNCLLALPLLLRPHFPTPIKHKAARGAPIIHSHSTTKSKSKQQHKPRQREGGEASAKQSSRLTWPWRQRRARAGGSRWPAGC